MKNKVIYHQFLAEVYTFAPDQVWPDAFSVGTFKAKYYTNQLILKICSDLIVKYKFLLLFNNIEVCLSEACAKIDFGSVLLTRSAERKRPGTDRYVRDTVPSTSPRQSSLCCRLCRLDWRRSRHRPLWKKKSKGFMLTFKKKNKYKQKHLCHSVKGQRNTCAHDPLSVCKQGKPK